MKLAIIMKEEAGVVSVMMRLRDARDNNERERDE